jgi:hypothetical protein
MKQRRNVAHDYHEIGKDTCASSVVAKGLAFVECRLSARWRLLYLTLVVSLSFTLVMRKTDYAIRLFIGKGFGIFQFHSQ